MDKVFPLDREASANFEENVVIVTLDSCRWDTFILSANKHLQKAIKFRKAFAQGTYTYPAHLSLYSGILPDCRDRIPYYNRFEKNLFRIQVRPASAKSFFTFGPTTFDIPTGFREKGYNTELIAALQWFDHKNLHQSFSKYTNTGIDTCAQLEIARRTLFNSAKPVFLLINIGETHEPYKFGGPIVPSIASRAQMRENTVGGFDKAAFDGQVECSHFVTEHLWKFIQFIEGLDRPTILVICGDHGECFGEDDCIGHGFYHPKVMEVPLGIAIVRPA